MEYENDDLKFSIKDMCFYVLFRWKKILIWAVICSLLLGAVQFGSLVFENENNAKNETVELEDKQNKDKLLLERKVEIYESLIDDYYEYMQNSILMQLDPLNTYCVEISLFISTDYQIMPDKFLQNPNYTSDLLAYYNNFVNDATTQAKIAAQVGTEAKYLREMMKVDAAGSWLEILVLHYDSEILEQIAELYLEYLEDVKDKVAESIGQHSLEVMQHTVTKYIGDGVVENQEHARQSITALEEELKAAQMELKSFGKNESVNILTQCIKMAVLGFAVGAVGAVVCLCVWFVFSDTVHSKEELESRLGIRVLGTVSNDEEKADPVTNLISRLMHEANNAQENYSLIAQRVNYCTADIEEIALVDYLDGAVTKNLADELNKCGLKRFVAIGNILADPVALGNLEKQKNIILVVQADGSKYNMLSKELIQLKDADCNTVGCILTE